MFFKHSVYILNSNEFKTQKSLNQSPWFKVWCHELQKFYLMFNKSFNLLTILIDLLINEKAIDYAQRDASAIRLLNDVTSRQAR